MKSFKILTLCIALSMISSLNAGGYLQIKSTKKGSELKEDITNAIGIETSFETREPSPLSLLCYSIMYQTNMCQLEIRHPEEILVATYYPDSEAQFNAINNKISQLFAPYTK